MSLRRCRLLAVAVVALAGCATKPQSPVDLPPAAAAGSEKVGVAVAALPKVELHLPGADCLLCIIAAQAMNSSLAKHLDTLDARELTAVQQAFADAIRRRGATAVVIAEPLAVKDLQDAQDSAPNAARKNFRPLKQKYGVDKLVVVQVEAIGMQRSYSAYFPTSDPRSLVRGAGYMVNLSNNTYEWYRPVMVLKAADGPWDEPPKYPGLTNAYYQALEMTKDQLLEQWRR